MLIFTHVCINVYDNVYGNVYDRTHKMLTKTVSFFADILPQIALYYPKLIVPTCKKPHISRLLLALEMQTTCSELHLYPSEMHFPALPTLQLDYIFPLMV